MRCTEVLTARVTADLKGRVKAAAEGDLVTEAAWLKRLVIREIRSHSSPPEVSSQQPKETRRTARAPDKHGPRSAVLVRLWPEDRLLLEARAEARGMRSASYAFVLIRAHLRQLSRIPEAEYQALRDSISELTAIGRSINQIARVANEGGRIPSSVREEFRAILKICEALRDNTDALLDANARSWKTGHAEDI